MKAGSRLEHVLRSGRFAVTAELNPPDSADPEEVYERGVGLVDRTVCDAINATDASGDHVHMSSVAVCALLTRAGYEPVMQISCRDRNRIAIQGDLLGAAALGVRNVLCLRFWCRQPTGIGDNEIWRIVKRNGILYLPDVGSKTTSFFSAFAGISASN